VPPYGAPSFFSKDVSEALRRFCARRASYQISREPQFLQRRRFARRQNRCSQEQRPILYRSPLCADRQPFSLSKTLRRVW